MHTVPNGHEHPSESPSLSPVHARPGEFPVEPAAAPIRWAFIACGLLALGAVWLHRYPAGVDLPQHANIFRLWADLAHGPFEVRATYHVELFTPYLLPYLVALPLTKLFGAVVATKLLLSFTVIATPFTMSRWLRTIGAAPAFGLLGFVVAFDYSYLWGFVSCAVATPLMFAYLASFEAQGSTPDIKAIARTSLLGLLLFFSHGITFGVSVAAAGASWLARGRWVGRHRAAAHVLPLVAMAVTWLVLQKQHTSSRAISQWFDSQRAINLFSGAFMPFPDHKWALVGAAGVALFLLFARPKLAFDPARSAPLAIALLGFIALPDWIAATWLVGSRFCVFVHAFAPALLVPRMSDPLARRWSAILFSLVLAFLIVLNVRLHAFNGELDGFIQVAAAIPAGADVQTLVPETSSESAVFGASMMGQIPAWITAEHGGLIANDSAVAGYFQIPIRRNSVPLFQYYPYVIARGDYATSRGDLRHLTRSAQGSARVVKTAGDWLLLKRPAIESDDFEVVRYAQAWGELRMDRAVSGRALSVAGVEYLHGLGTHAQSFARIRFKRAAKMLLGACGVDDAAGSRGHAGFRIRDGRGHILFDSGEMSAEASAKPFSVLVGAQQELVLESYTLGRIDSAHADWVNLAVR